MQRDMRESGFIHPLHIIIIINGQFIWRRLVKNSTTRAPGCSSRLVIASRSFVMNRSVKIM